MSNNLDFPEVQANQDNKEATIVEAQQRFDAAFTDFLSIDFTGADKTLSNTEFREHFVFRSANLSVARALNVPAIKRPFVVDNTAGSDKVTVTRGSTTIDVATGKRMFFYTDGTADGLINIPN